MEEKDFRELVRQVAYEQAKASTTSFFFTGEDNLRARSFGTLAGVELSVEGRFLNPQGRLQSFAERHVPNSDGTQASTLITLGEGFLLNVNVRANVGAPRRGQVFVIVEVVRGRTGAVIPLATLLQDYVTDTQGLGWPGAPIVPSQSGNGFIRSITGTDPAAGVEISETVPTNRRWRPLSVIATLTTDATVASRLPNIFVDDGASVLWRRAAGTPLTASLSLPFCWGVGVQDFTVITNWFPSGPLPERYNLSQGFRIRTTTTALQAGDNWGAPQLLVEEHIED